MVGDYVHVCFAPSENFDNQKEAKAFGENIAEPIILLHYLIQTKAVINNLIHPRHLLENDWWDWGVDGDRHKDYVEMLVRRHKLNKKVEKELMDNKKIKRPDILTYKGLIPKWLDNFGDVVKFLKGDRNEYYEIKPHSDSGKTAGKDKLEFLKYFYKKSKLDYKPGSFYPQSPSGKTKIGVNVKFPKNLNYLLDLELKNLGVEIYNIELEVERVEYGLLLYKFCVNFKRPRRSDNKEKFIATRILTNFMRNATIDLDAETSRQIMVATGMLEIVEFDYKVERQPIKISAITNVHDVPLLKIRWDPIADVLEDKKNGIRNALYSRFIGKPGDRYFLCADKNYYQQAYFIPSRARMAGDLKKFQVQYFVSPIGPKNIAVLEPYYSKNSKPLTEWEYFLTYSKTGEIVIELGLVFLTAALIYAVAYLSAAAMAEGPLLGAGAALTSVPTPVPVPAPVPALAPVVEQGAKVISFISRSEAVKETGIAASIMISALSFAPSEAKAAAIPNEILAGNVNSTTLKGIPAWLVANNINDARSQRVWTEPGVKKAIEEAVAARDVGLISISASPVYERGSESNPGNRLGMPPVGRLYLVKVNDQIDKPPPLYGEINIRDRFNNKMYYFGSLKID